MAEKRPYVHAVGHCSRCKTTVEPRLSLQWFVNTGPLAQRRRRRGARRPGPDRAGRAGQALLRLGRQHARLVHLAAAVVGAPDPGLVRPERRDGLRRPGRSSRPTGEGWRQDEDVLDTWFSSALWPFSTLGWPDAHRGPGEVLSDQRAGDRLRHPVLLGRPDDDVRPVRDGRHASPSTWWPCTAWCATSTARRCPSRSATWSTRWTGSSASAPTPPGSPWPAAPTPARTCRSARSGARARATSATSCGTRPGSR